MNEASPKGSHLDAGVAASVAAILRNQHASGAFVASPDFAQYQYCWLRDGSFIAHALDIAGELGAAEHFHVWCATAISGIAPLIAAALDRHFDGQPVDAAKMPPARFSLDGLAVSDDWPNFQVDGYGTWLWSLHQHLQAAGGRALPSRFAPAVEVAARYLDIFGNSPCYDVWEEAGGSVHTATLGCAYGGLRAAAAMLNDSALAERAHSLALSLVDDARRYGRFRKSDHSHDVDASLLWLCEPFHVVPPGEHAFVETVRRITAELDLDGGIRRYPGDTYYGGGAWPVLTASLGWHRPPPATSWPPTGAGDGWLNALTPKGVWPSSSGETSATPSTMASGSGVGGPGRRSRLVTRYVHRAGHRARAQPTRSNCHYHTRAERLFTNQAMKRTEERKLEMRSEAILHTNKAQRGRKRSLGAGVACTTLAASAALMGLSPTVALAKTPTVSLQFWNAYNPTDKEAVTMQNVVLKKFEAENPGIKVTSVVVPYGSLLQKFIAAAAAGNPPALHPLGHRLGALSRRPGSASQCDPPEMGPADLKAALPGPLSTNAFKGTLQAFEVPIVGMDFGGTELIHQITQAAGNVILEDQFLLIHAFQQLVA